MPPKHQTSSIDDQKHRRFAPDLRRRMAKASRRSAVAFAITMIAGAATIAAWRGEADMSSRQEEVARRGALVMPFSLESTTHLFQPRSFGGIQTVIADDPDDGLQLRLIREHLSAEAAAFSQGDFGDPAAIHGRDMPGLQELETNHRSISVRFEAIPEGARITYRTDDPATVAALHAWFEAQVSDHGEHAEH